MRCPKEVGAYQAAVGDAALTYLSYDPNYAEDDCAEDMDDDEMDEDDDEEEDYSDDDDVSWKVSTATLVSDQRLIAAHALLRGLQYFCTEYLPASFPRRSWHPRPDFS